MILALGRSSTPDFDEGSSLVYVAAMTHAKNQYEKSVVVDLVDDAVAAGTYSPLTGAPDQPRRRRRARLLGEQLDSGLNPSPDIGIELT